jgi:G3E family GTPase
LSGFLGAGKTTLVSAALKQAQRAGLRLAIVSNEFGDTGIDRALLDAGQDGLVELDGGCVCCKLSDALDETLLGLLDRARPDCLIVETSGVALPGEILLHFWRPPLSDRIDTVRCAVVVDAVRAQALAADPTFLDQIEAADLLLVSKIDLVDEAGRAETHALLARATHGKPTVDVSFGDIALETLFSADAEPLPRRDVPSDEPHDHDHAQFSSRVLTFPGVVVADEVVASLRTLGALRVKGFVQTAHGPRLIQGVADRITVEAPPVPPPAHLIGTLVVIDRATQLPEVSTP